MVIIAFASTRCDKRQALKQIESEIITFLKIGLVKDNAIPMMEAIKLYRGLTGIGDLKESKKYVEWVIEKYHIQPA